MTVLLCLAAAAGYAVSSVLQQRAAAQEARRHSLRVSLLFRLARRPWWLAGKAVDILATVLQAIAIHVGSVVLVEPLMASGLLFALPLGARMSGRRPEPRDWLGTVTLTAGLAAFVATTRPSGGRSDAPPGVWLVAGAVIGVVVMATLAVFRDEGRPHRAAWLAGVGGILYAGTATLTKPAARAWVGGPARFSTCWQLYALLGVSVAAAIAVQSAFQIGSVVASLPALTAVEPIAGVALGVGVLGEHLSTGAREFPALIVAFAAILAGITLLARSPLVAASHQDAERGDQPVIEEALVGDPAANPAL